MTHIISQDFGKLEEIPKHVFWTKGKGMDGMDEGALARMIKE